MQRTKGFKDKITKKAKASNKQNKAKASNKKNKAKRDAYYAKTYNHKKIVTLPKTNINMNDFRSLPKDVIKTIIANKPAAALYPVLCRLSNFEKQKFFQISNENLAIYSGLGLTKVSEGLQFLGSCTINNEKKLLQIKKLQKENRRFNTYGVYFQRKTTPEEWQIIKFYSYLIDSGIWAKLSNSCKAVYLSLWVQSEWPKWKELDIEEARELYPQRDFEAYVGLIKDLKNTANVDYKTVHKALKALEDKGLVSIIGKVNSSLFVVETFFKSIKN